MKDQYLSTKEYDLCDQCAHNPNNKNIDFCDGCISIAEVGPVTFLSNVPVGTSVYYRHKNFHPKKGADYDGD